MKHNSFLFELIPVILCILNYIKVSSHCKKPKHAQLKRVSIFMALYSFLPSEASY